MLLYDRKLEIGHNPKELPFFAVPEDIHTACFAAAQKSLRENAALDPADRAAADILAACRWLAETKAFVFIENDAELLLRRLPGTICISGKAAAMRLFQRAAVSLL